MVVPQDEVDDVPVMMQRQAPVIQKEDVLQESVQLVDKDLLSEDLKCTLEDARIRRDVFLQQYGFTDYDVSCLLEITIGIVMVIVGLLESAQKVMAESTGESKITWNVIALVLQGLTKQMTDMQFEMPRMPKKHLHKVLKSPLLFFWYIMFYRALAGHLAKPFEPG